MEGSWRVSFMKNNQQRSRLNHCFNSAVGGAVDTREKSDMQSMRCINTAGRQCHVWKCTPLPLLLDRLSSSALTSLASWEVVLLSLVLLLFCSCFFLLFCSMVSNR
uniref:Uncharacterized protein n=1 Tax=Ditylenchus dipsaci TaxID=166011 RepID=A0A915EKB9_9BILA